MLKLLFENDSQEEALKMRDMIFNSLKGVPGFKTGDITLCSQRVNPDTNEPSCEDGNMEIITEGYRLQHVVEIVISGGENDSGVTHTIASKISKNQRIEKCQLTQTTK